MTSLIDVIFLLLLFFMLTSTFTKFAEVELTAAGAGSGPAPEAPPLFLKLGEEQLSVNLQSVEMSALAQELTAKKASEPALVVLVSLDETVTAQRLTDLLVVLRSVPGLKPTVLGAS